MRIHADTKPTYKCTLCEREFKAKISLNGHTPHCINKYNTSTIYKDYVQKHKAKHGISQADLSRMSHRYFAKNDIRLKEPRCICQHCGLKLKNEICIQTHVSTHTRGNTYQCNHCDELLCPKCGKGFAQVKEVEYIFRRVINKNRDVEKTNMIE